MSADMAGLGGACIFGRWGVDFESRRKSAFSDNRLIGVSRVGVKKMGTRCLVTVTPETSKLAGVTAKSLQVRRGAFNTMAYSMGVQMLANMRKGFSVEAMAEVQARFLADVRAEDRALKKKLVKRPAKK